MSNNIGGFESTHESACISHWHDPESDEFVITDGNGAYIYDEDGNEYLDLISSLYCTNAGHSNQHIIDACNAQLQAVPYVSSSQGNDSRTALADKLATVAPESFTDVVFSVSGSEANELAVQFARKAKDAPKVLTRWRSYHGSTYGAGALTGEPGTRNAVESHATATGAVKFLPPVAHNSPFDADSPEELGEKAASHVEYVIRNEGPDSIAALLIEPVAGSSGGYPAPPGYFERLRELCDMYDIFLIADEVITGFGRCGEMFGIQTENVEPDMITFAKGVTSGYAPLAGVIMSDTVGEHVREGTNLGQTFAGHPVACAAGLAAVEEYEDHLIDDVQKRAPVLERELRSLEEKHDVITDVRGRGFLWTIVVENPRTGEPFVDSVTETDVENPVHAVVDHAKEHGVLLTTGRPEYQLMLCPPFCIDEDEIRTAVETLDSAFEDVFR
ncbi:class III aminotransferase [Natrialba chahannaoensis JCM 10990]|uniref:Class III aminotransferase n=1 Tax=Natrialba chahannaoensis JCM 10990 TaxID=1227492 RepID=M0AC69_9EURY|nr:aminotransferase class III-fold pyridoxal phosphate-dependent enzyme [Natrialba chahannaoensis]ELY96124.1 class III aminotransferase [Natrialba chahannaoensis JCM 10990]